MVTSSAETDENLEVDTEETETSQESEGAEEADKTDDKAEDTDEGGEPKAEDTDEEEVEDWLKGDDHTSQAEKKFTDGDIGKAKAKLKAKVKLKDGEIEKLQAEIAELKVPKQAQPSNLQKPKRDDFFEADDPEDAYTDALMDWKLNNHQATQAAANATVNQQRAQSENELRVSQGEDKHYERAGNLVNESNISSDKYQAADGAFRQAIEDVAPGDGDNIAAALVTRLGPGSEKVVYNMGVNKAKLVKFAELLRSDPMGLDAYGYLVELKTELNSPNKRKTNAPTPAAEVKGDMVVNDLKKQLEKAESSGDIQAQVSLKSNASREIKVNLVI